MNRTTATVLVVVAALAVVYLGFELVTRMMMDAVPVPAAESAGDLLAEADAAETSTALPPGQQDAAGLRTQEVTLYFTRPDALGLAPETRAIFETTELLDRIKQVVGALIAGPASDSPLLPVLPAGTPLRGLFLGDDGTLYLDLGQRLVRNLFPGTRSELLAVTSLANTLSANFAEVRRVQILVEGEQVHTLTGHLDLTAPVAPDLSLNLPPEMLPFPLPPAESEVLPEVAPEESSGTADGIW